MPSNEDERIKEAQKALERGELPKEVVQRLLKEKTGDLPWTSTLSVNEWLLLKQYSIKPLGQVMGSCFYHIGYSIANQVMYGNSYDFSDVKNAMYDSRHLALERLAQEAKVLGAHAVVGVKLHLKKPTAHGHETEFVAMGTAISIQGIKLPEKPILCTVSGQELVKLLYCGSVPVGIAIGIDIQYAYTGYEEQSIKMSWQNREFSHYTDKVYRSRNKGIANMKADAARMGANGLLAHETNFEIYEVEVERNDQERTDYIVEFISVGTAITNESGHKIQGDRPKIILNMNDKKRGN